MHSEPAPSHWTQAEPSAEHDAFVHAVAQHTLAPASVGTHVPDAQSVATAHAAPLLARQTPATSCWVAAQTQVPSVPQTRPAAAHAGSQHRLVPVRSIEHAPEAHCSVTSQTVPVGRSSAHSPVSGLQPLPQTCSSTAPLVHDRETDPTHSVPVPSQSTQPLPLLAQVLPAAAHAIAQQICAPDAVGSQAPLAHCSFAEHAAPSTRVHPPSPHAHSAAGRSSVGLQSAIVRHVPKARHEPSSMSSG